MRRRAAVQAAVGAAAWLVGAPAMADWQLAREERFDAGGTLDPAFWGVETGFLRNQEAQYYRDRNLAFAPGMLRIGARREEVPNAAYRPGARNWRQSRATSRYTSASLYTRPAFLYGRFEVVARSSGGAGVWPAIWLLHESAGQYGEIDIFEAVGKHADTAFAGVHYGREPDTRQHRSANRQVLGLENSWHTHAVEWTPERITVLLDGQPLLVFDPATAAVGGADPLRQPMRLRINLALGGTWGGTIDEARLPAHLDIASVRIWRWQPGAGLGAAGAAAPATAATAAPATATASAPVAVASDPVLPTPRWGR